MVNFASCLLNFVAYDSAESQDLIGKFNINKSTIGGNSIGFLFTDSLYLGCFQDNPDVRALPNSQMVPWGISGADMIRWCYNTALNANAFYFSLQSGNNCFWGEENQIFDRYGPSNGCTYSCGSEPYPSGLVCGGWSINSVYQLEVNQTY